MVVFGVTYTMTGCDKWIRYQVALIVGRYGATELNGFAPLAILHRAKDLGSRYGVAS